MENLGCIGTQVHGDCNIRPWNGEGSCIRGGYPCIGCTEPAFGEREYPYLETPKRGGIPLGLPTDMPKAWFVALAALAKAATPERLRRNAVAETISVRARRRSREAKEMSRLVVGPFNRVEGDLEIKLDVEDGAVTAAYVNSPLYRGFEQILLGKAPATRWFTRRAFAAFARFRNPSPPRARWPRRKASPRPKTARACRT